MAVQTIAKVDEAWVTKLGGLTIPASPETGADKAVDVFIEKPHVTEEVHRTYPSIGIRLLSLGEDGPRREEGEEKIRESLDTSSVPHMAQMRDKGEPYRLVYSVDTWAREFAQQDRAMQQIIATRLKLRGTLTLVGTSPEGADEDVWLFRTGFTNADMDEGDVVVYHKAYTYEVVVCLADSALEGVALAHEFRLGFKKARRAVDLVSGDADLRDDLTITVSE